MSFASSLIVGSLSAKSSTVSLLVASLSIDFLGLSINPNPHSHDYDYRRVRSSDEIVKHNPGAAFQVLKSVRRIRLNDVEKAKKNKRNDDHRDGPFHKHERKQRDQLARNLVDDDLTRIFPAGNLLGARAGPDTGKYERQDRNDYQDGPAGDSRESQKDRDTHQRSKRPRSEWHIPDPASSNRQREIISFFQSVSSVAK